MGNQLRVTTLRTNALTKTRQDLTHPIKEKLHIDPRIVSAKKSMNLDSEASPPPIKQPTIYQRIFPNQTAKDSIDPNIQIDEASERLRKRGSAGVAPNNKKEEPPIRRGESEQ